jgi:hypothetical protein
VELLAKATLNVQIFLNRFSINGQERDIKLKPGMTLLDILIKVGRIYKFSWIMREKRIRKRRMLNKII